MRITKWQVQEVLKQVIFFKKQNNIVDLEMVNNIEINGNNITIKIVFPDVNDPSVVIVSNSATKLLKEDRGLRT